MKKAVSQELARQETKSSFEAWCRYALAPFEQEPARHHLLLISWLGAISRGDIDRLMILMPPGSGKSVYASVLFPAWWYSQHPRSSVLALSHTAELAMHFGRRVKNTVLDNVDALGYQLEADNQAAGRWSTSKGGEYFAAGVGGAIAGRRCDLAIIDDPVRGREDAESETVRDKIFDWYRSDLYSRRKPNARIVLIQTRWHEMDLGGRLLADMAVGGDQWHVIKLPALATEENDPLGRAIGEPLWPEIADLTELDRTRRGVGERDWAALYQQEPRPPEGSIFKTGMISTIDHEPEGEVVRSWDLAATKATGTSDPDWTVGVKLIRTRSDHFVIADVFRDRLPPEGVEAAILRIAEKDGHGIKIGIPQDPGQAGKSQILYLSKKLIGFFMESIPMSGDKSTRAMPAASQMNSGNFSMVRANWNSRLCDELAGFPDSAHDDQVDALSYGFHLLNPDSLNIWARLAGP